VRDLILRGDAFERSRAILAATELRDRGALPLLIELVAARPKDTAETARAALVDITKQDFGVQERRWRAWWADNEDVPRIRWLIEGLSSKDDDIRRTSQQELNRLTGQFLGHRHDATRAERDAGVQAWHDWWRVESATSGKWP
jgi:hypothetical protein